MKEMDKLEVIEDSFPYNDILNIEYPFPLIRERQDISIRAGMFAPFEALTGYDEHVKETERYTDYEIFLDDDNRNLLDEKLNFIKKNLNKIEVKITYFVKDKRKSGGKYITKIGKIKKIDNYKEEFVFEDRCIIKIKDIVQIDINKYD